MLREVQDPVVLVEREEVRPHMSLPRRRVQEGLAMKHRGKSRVEIPYHYYFKSFGIPEPVTEKLFHPSRKFRLDLAWPKPLLLPNQDVAIEVQGGVWRAMGGAHQGVGHIRDMEKINWAQRLGWKVFQFIPDDIRSGAAALWLLDYRREVMVFGKKVQAIEPQGSTEETTKPGVQARPTRASQDGDDGLRGAADGDLDQHRGAEGDTKLGHTVQEQDGD